MKRLVMFWMVGSGLFGHAAASDLLQIYDLAVKSDPQLASAEATRNATLENRPQSIARLLPSVNLAASANRTHSAFFAEQPTFQRSNNPADGRSKQNLSDFWDSRITIQLTQPVYRHDLWVQLAQADAQIAQAEADYLSRQQELMVRTAQAYFKVLEADDNLEFATTEKQSIERQLDQAKERFEVGLNAITDVHEAQAGYDQAVANEIAAANQVDSAWEALNEIVGESPDHSLERVRDELVLSPPEPTNLEKWNDMALENNLAIISAENRTKVAEKNISIQQAGHLPTLDLVANYAFTDNTNNRLVFSTSGSEISSIGLQINVPIFQGGAVNSRTRQARHNFTAAQEDLDRQRRLAARQVKDSYRGVISTISRVGALKAAVTSSQSALEASEAGFQVGTRTTVDVLTSQRNLTRAKADYAKSRYDYIVNGLLLRQAAGLLTREDLEQVNRLLQ